MPMDISAASKRTSGKNPFGVSGHARHEFADGIHHGHTSGRVTVRTRKQLFMTPRVTMRRQQRIATLSAWILVFLAMCLRVAPAHAAGTTDQVSADNIQAAMRTLNFLESLPKEGTITVGVVYCSCVPAAQTMAEATAQLIGTMRGPNSRALKPLVISTDALAQSGDHLDVLFLVAGASKDSTAIVDTMRRRHLPSLSDDPSCADTGCCVVLVRTGQRVEILLNTSLADAVGARFSLVFTMVVKRK
jgi:YfiR/HmsC-like